jgi:hypothetical protein
VPNDGSAQLGGVSDLKFCPAIFFLDLFFLSSRLCIWRRRGSLRQTTSQFNKGRSPSPVLGLWMGLECMECMKSSGHLLYGYCTPSHKFTIVA